MLFCNVTLSSHTSVLNLSDKISLTALCNWRLQQQKQMKLTVISLAFIKKVDSILSEKCDHFLHPTGKGKSLVEFHTELSNKDKWVILPVALNNELHFLRTMLKNLIKIDRPLRAKRESWLNIQRLHVDEWKMFTKQIQCHCPLLPTSPTLPPVA